MVDLSVNFAGIELKNPIISAASSLGNHLDKLKRLEEAGVAAVTTKLISNAVQPPEHEFPYRCVAGKAGWMLVGDQNLPLDYGMSLVAAAKKTLSIPVIANFVGVEANVDSWVENALALERAGADALEMDLYCPMSGAGTLAGTHPDLGHGYTSICAYPDELGRVVRALLESIHVPLIPKLNPMVTSVLTVASACVSNGAKCLTMGNMLSTANPGVDIRRKGAPLIPHAKAVAGHPYMGDYLFPIQNRHLSVLKAAYGRDVAISSGGGLFTWEQIVQRVMLGAHTVQLCSAIIMNGLTAVRRCLHGLEQYMLEQGYSRLDDLRDMALSGVAPRATVQVEPAVARVKSPVACLGCADKCVDKVTGDCLAMSMGARGVPVIDSSKCTGCAWCLWHCPTDALELVVSERFVDIWNVPVTVTVG